MNTTLKIQEDLLAYCEALAEAAQSASLPESATERIARLRQSVLSQELLVPVLGAVESGKSTLINRMLRKERLPVAEAEGGTLLPTELRYDAAEERIEAVGNSVSFFRRSQDDGVARSDDNVTRFGVDEIGTVGENAAHYSHARLYLNQTFLQDIEPLVLVDMPGFDSPLDPRNEAIMTYIERGSHYFVLASMEDGVSADLLRHVREIAEISHDISFFLTKADVAPQDKVAERARVLTEVLRDTCNLTGKVVIPISRTSPDAVIIGLLGSIDAESLFFKRLQNPAREAADGLADSINLQINALEKDRNILASAIDELRDAPAILRSSAKSLLENLLHRYSGNDYNGVINNIASDVFKAVEKIRDLFSYDDLESDSIIKSRYAPHVRKAARTELNISVRRHLGNLNQEIVSGLSGLLERLDKAMSNLGVSEFTQKLAGVVTSRFSNPGIFSSTGTGAPRTLLTAATRAHLADMAEIVAKNFSPHYYYRERSVADSIQPELQKLFDNAARDLFEQVRAQYKEQISQKKAELEAILQAKDSGADKEQRLAELEKARAAVIAAADELLER
jgi:GTPase SAR1 family protein